MAISPSSPTSQLRGRPKLKTKTLDGTAIDEDDQADELREERQQSSSRHWKGSDRGVPSWLEGMSC